LKTENAPSCGAVLIAFLMFDATQSRLQLARQFIIFVVTPFTLQAHSTEKVESSMVGGIITIVKRQPVMSQFQIFRRLRVWCSVHAPPYFVNKAGLEEG
ncbi:hypothetical protein OS493_026996, partial [Desmophyllum pertusum]